ncbi:MAG: Cytochrome c [Candidatus Accumulibacter appositus]|uniref:Cytochrome c n=1 Tax=Candidatus Accumulibacter appositus TaxID=1454003 RepID=A0A011PU87_9PROT|nr:c-type cytochrome [Accumulibacter sp.]EXI80592.1 MAG: Cytochrome c [Candidatus Accumulibacter appositus]HRF05627.1 c-type cytochrome [Accumulibacter sp.]
MQGLLALIAVPIALALGPLQRAEAADGPKTWPFSVPAESTIPAGPLGEAIKLGQKVVTDTQSQARAYVGNGLNCSSCHLNGGTVAGAAPFVGLWGVFPEYRSRSASVNALQTRINDCFERSMNGKALPEESPEMIGVLSYVWWLSQGVPTGMDSAGRGFKKILAPATPDKARGKSIYAQKCAACHGIDGAGLNKPDGSYMFPALWGPKAFNIGAGMARLDTAAAFVKANMPLAQGGTLTDQEAYDVAAFFTTQARPDLAGKENDWRKGGKPKDARY